ncbi:MAG: L-aspartate oxidase [Bacteroidetes bacterium]|nr:L-aspartate oxidase [Bacteroidota bacterium]
MTLPKFDIAIVGSGIAGLFYAIRCAGDGLCDLAAVTLLAKNARNSILELEQLNVKFNKTSEGTFDLHREGGHSHSRVVHSNDATGKEVENSLVKIVRNHPNITILEHHFATNLIINDQVVQGINVLDISKNCTFNISSKITMLATGGGAQVYLHNSNPPLATGDGFAMAYRAGVLIKDMEFVQFHPTIFYGKDSEAFLITEALRGFGAELKLRDGRTFMEKYHPMKSLAPRDIVSRAIISEMSQTSDSSVFLDLRNLNQSELKIHFPNIYARCVKEGLDLSKDMIPVAPAAHYFCGGIQTDLSGRTSAKNLYACGECSCTGVHGANRLASNSLLEGLVFAEEAALDTAKFLPTIKQPEIDLKLVHQKPYDEPNKLSSKKKRLQNLMWTDAGIIREGTSLNNCLEELNKLKIGMAEDTKEDGLSKDFMELSNMIETSLLIVQSAILRKESRGCHYRSDYPDKNPCLTHTLMEEAPKRTECIV